MDLEHKAIERLKMAAELSKTYYEKPLVVMYSGGKDSDVVLELCKRAEIPFEVAHSHTTADAPETVRYIRGVFHELELAGVHCMMKYPVYKGRRTSMWQLIVDKQIPPTRVTRYCCSICKETASPHRYIALGVRRAESISRKGAGVAEMWGRTKTQREVFDFDNGDKRIIMPCQVKAKVKVHPIVDWEDKDVWRFLKDTGISVNPVYRMGFMRVGCIGCPLAGNARYAEFRQWPKYEGLYRRAFERMLEARSRSGKESPWNTADEVFRWWMEDKNLDGQLDLFGGEVGA